MQEFKISGNPLPIHVVITVIKMASLELDSVVMDSTGKVSCVKGRISHKGQVHQTSLTVEELYKMGINVDTGEITSGISTAEVQSKVREASDDSLKSALQQKNKDKEASNHQYENETVMTGQSSGTEILNEQLKEAALLNPVSESPACITQAPRKAFDISSRSLSVKVNSTGEAPDVLTTTRSCGSINRANAMPDNYPETAELHSVRDSNLGIAVEVPFVDGGLEQSEEIENMDCDISVDGLEAGATAGIQSPTTANKSPHHFVEVKADNVEQEVIEAMGNSTGSEIDHYNVETERDNPGLEKSHGMGTYQAPQRSRPSHRRRRPRRGRPRRVQEENEGEAIPVRIKCLSCVEEKTFSSMRTYKNHFKRFHE